MGFVSYFEDIVDQLAEDLERLKLDIETPRSNLEECLQPLRRWVGEAEVRLRELRDLVDLATDPTIDLAQATSEALRESRRARQDLAAAQAGAEEARRKVGSLEARLAKVEQELHESRKENRRLNRRLELVFSRHPEDVYDAFSSEEDMRRARREG